jgi:hypothetical protein
MLSTRLCRYCGTLYVPDCRTAKTQKACSRSACRRERQRQAYQAWAARNRDYDSARRGNIRRWAKNYPDYWKGYRQTHPAYRERNRRRTRERLRDRRAMFAKQNAMARPIEGILTYLVTREVFAKQNAMGTAGSEPLHSAA